MVTAMRHVTTTAVIIFDGPMEKLFVLKLVGKRGQDLVLGNTQGFVMAGHAEGGWLTGQQETHG